MIENNQTLKSGQLIDRVFTILETLNNKGAVGIRELSRLTGLSPSTIQRIVSSLGDIGYLIKEPASKQYRLSYKFFYLANGALNQSMLPVIAMPFLTKLSQEIKETIGLATLDKKGFVIYVGKASCKDHPIPIEIGNRYSAHCNAIGKAILAYLSEEKLEEILNNLLFDAYTPHTITSYKSLNKQLLVIRKRGYAISKEERVPREIILASPIMDHWGVVGAFGVHSVTNRITRERVPIIGNILVRAAKEISLSFSGKFEI